MRISFMFILCFVLTVFSLSGCSYLPQKDDSMSQSSAVLEPSASIKFSDLPIPAGFKLLPDHSYSFESSGVRVGVLKYRGKAAADQLVNFYKEQMPMYNWSLLNVVEYGDRLLNFERENETCIVSLSNQGRRTILTLSIGPRPQVTRKPKQPIK